MHHASAKPADIRLHARLDEAMRTAVLLGIALVTLVPAARDTHATIGWLPLWLVGMPAVAWWALRGFAMPRRAQSRADGITGRRSVRPLQAKRRLRRVPLTDLRRAA